MRRPPAQGAFAMIRRFARYELKYLLPIELGESLIAELQQHMDVDVHSGPDGYRLASLYYDSPGLDCFWAKVDGSKFRRKLRVRMYSDTDIENVPLGLVEIKERTNQTVQKRRLALPLELAMALCAGQRGSHALQLEAADAEVAAEVSTLVETLRLQPTAITAYRRHAFVGRRNDEGLRVTFDTDLRGRTHALRVDARVANRLILPLDWCVMEVKSDVTIPEWLSERLDHHRCQLRRISKYCAALATLSNLAVPGVLFPQTRARRASLAAFTAS
jgi:SPX domain protein involved in polyphosphate accumulation